MLEVYFSTVIRGAPLNQGGELVRLDWAAKRVIGRVTIEPVVAESGPRLFMEGARGIELFEDSVVVCGYNTIKVFSRDLKHQKDLEHGLMVGLHETCPAPQGLFATSTAIDAAIEFDLSGKMARSYWPREMVQFQNALGLEPLNIDKNSDNRTRFGDAEHLKHRSHLHLNAVAVYQGDTYALFNRFGAICNLDRREIVARDNRIKGGHNLLIDGDIAIVNDTKGQTVRFYDLRSGDLVRVIDLFDYPVIRRIHRKHTLMDRARRQLAKFGLKGRPVHAPLVVRGLDLHGRRLYVGLSPAMFLEIDLRDGALIDWYQYSRDAGVKTHGVKVSPC